MYNKLNCQFRVLQIFILNYKNMFIIIKKYLKIFNNLFNLLNYYKFNKIIINYLLKIKEKGIILKDI